MARSEIVLLITMLASSTHDETGTSKPSSLSIGEVFPELDNRAPVSELSATFVDGPGGGMQTTHLDKVELHDNLLTASGNGYRVAFTVQPRDTYLVLRIKEVDEPRPGTLMKLRFYLGPDNLFTLTRLDYMSVPTDGDRGMAWPWIWPRMVATRRPSAPSASICRRPTSKGWRSTLRTRP